MLSTALSKHFLFLIVQPRIYSILEAMFNPCMRGVPIIKEMASIGHGHPILYIVRE